METMETAATVLVMVSLGERQKLIVAGVRSWIGMKTLAPVIARERHPSHLEQGAHCSVQTVDKAEGPTRYQTRAQQNHRRRTPCCQHNQTMLVLWGEKKEAGGVILRVNTECRIG